MEVRVVVKQSRASLQEWTDRVGIAVVGDGLVWTHGPELTKEMVARRVLEPLFRAI
jgi:hypothetical protein